VRFVEDIRDTGRARVLAGRIAELCVPGRAYRVVAACGGHRPVRFGGYLPDAVTVESGAGCPMCALPAARFDVVRQIGADPDVVVAAYADRMTPPHAVAGVKRVHSPLDALTIARHNPELRVVFWAAGFEDTAPSTAIALIRAVSEGVRNFSVLCDHLRLPALLAQQDADGFVVPAQVSTVIGCAPYAVVSRPVVVAGAEPLDVLQAVSLVMQQVRDGRTEVENASRAAQWDGNPVALGAVTQVFEPSGAAGLRIRPQFAAYDAAPARAADPVL
jgi:hydrogenase expression/formation protein HypD